MLSALPEGGILAACSHPGGVWCCLDAMHEVGVLLGEGWGYSGYVGASCSTDNPRLVDPRPRGVCVHKIELHARSAYMSRLEMVGAPLKWRPCIKGVISRLRRDSGLGRCRAVISERRASVRQGLVGSNL